METSSKNSALSGLELGHDLGRLTSPERVFTEGHQLRQVLQDGTGNRGITGQAEALVLPESTEEVAQVMAWCYSQGVPLVPRGGGTGLAGGAVPHGGIVMALDLMNRVLSIDPEFWRMEVEAGVRTATVHRVALENGLLFPPDPGASEQSTIGGNLATNAGGPHAFKYGVTGNWVTGIEAVVPPGEVLRAGGPLRKDVAGLDLTSLLVGSEGSLGIITSAWLNLIPAPESRGIAVGFYRCPRSGCDAISTILGSGIQAAALEFLDGAAMSSSLGSFPFGAPDEVGFAVLAEADGSESEVERQMDELEEAMGSQSIGPVLKVSDRREIAGLWNWRDGVSIAVTAQKGGKISEDVVVPAERLADAIEETVQIGLRHGLEACSWGHAGDNNLHSTFMVDLTDSDEIARGSAAADEVFEMAIRMGGSISGEHGLGTLKTKHSKLALGEAAIRIQADLKRVFDPELLLNPGKKIVMPDGQGKP